MKSEMRPWEETRENNAPPRGVEPARATAAAAPPTMQTVSGYYGRCLQETRRRALLDIPVFMHTTSKCVDAAAKELKREAKTPSAPSCLTTGTRLRKKKRKEKKTKKKKKEEEQRKKKEKTRRTDRCRPDLGGRRKTPGERGTAAAECTIHPSTFEWK